MTVNDPSVKQAHSNDPVVELQLSSSASCESGDVQKPKSTIRRLKTQYSRLDVLPGRTAHSTSYLPNLAAERAVHLRPTLLSLSDSLC